MTNVNTTLREAAREMDINKSKLHYYVSIGLIEPDGEVAGVFVFNKTKLLRRIRRISTMRGKNMSLKKIKNTLNK